MKKIEKVSGHVTSSQEYPHKIVSLTEEEYRRIIENLGSDPEYRDLPEEQVRSRIDSLISRSPFANIMDDKVFDMIFGKNKEFLLLLLQSILPEYNISSVDYLSNRTITESSSERYGIYDVVCKTGSGEYIDIEAQKVSRAIDRNRWAFYLSDLVRRQYSKERKKYKEIKPSFCIVIEGENVNWYAPQKEEIVKLFSGDNQERVAIDKLKQVKLNPEGNSGSCIMHFKMIDIYSLSSYGNQLNIILINPAKMNKSAEELTTKLDKFLYLCKNLSKLVEVPPELLDDFGNMVEALSFDKMRREDFEKYICRMFDADFKRELAKERYDMGMRDGLAKAEEQFTTEKQELAKERYDMGMRDGLAKAEEQFTTEKQELAKERYDMGVRDGLAKAEERYVSGKEEERKRIMELISGSNFSSEIKDSIIKSISSS